MPMSKWSAVDRYWGRVFKVAWEGVREHKDRPTITSIIGALLTFLGFCIWGEPMTPSRILEGLILAVIGGFAGFVLVYLREVFYTPMRLRDDGAGDAGLHTDTQQLAFQILEFARSVGKGPIPKEQEWKMPLPEFKKRMVEVPAWLDKINAGYALRFKDKTINIRHQFVELGIRDANLDDALNAPDLNYERLTAIGSGLLSLITKLDIKEHLGSNDKPESVLPEKRPIVVASRYGGAKTKQEMGWTGICLQNDGEPAYEISPQEQVSVGADRLEVGGHCGRLTKGDEEAFFAVHITLEDGNGTFGDALYNLMVKHKLDSVVVPVTYRDADMRWYQSDVELIKDQMQRSSEGSLSGIRLNTLQKRIEAPKQQ